VNGNPPTGMGPQAAPVPLTRRHWWQRIGVAVLIWGLESVIGLIPYIAHEASATLSVRGSNSNVLPELCVLAVVCSALALLALLRDWFFGEAKQATALMLILAIANVFACLTGAFVYPLADNNLLTSGMERLPLAMLAGALTASFLLAAERGFSSDR